MKRSAMPVQKDFALSGKLPGMPEIIFSHAKHTVWSGCEGCHPEIFTGVKRGTTKYTMVRDLRGEVLRRLPRLGGLPDPRLPAVPLEAGAVMAAALGSRTSPRPPRRPRGPRPRPAGALEPGAGAAPQVARAHAEDDWFGEFEVDLLADAGRDDASPATSIRALVSRCDRLKPRIEGLDPSRRKVYVKRLQQCRDVYQFVLDTRGQG